jgi:hypothetical protein
LWSVPVTSTFGAGTSTMSGPGRAPCELPGLRSTASFALSFAPTGDRSPRACPGRGGRFPCSRVRVLRVRGVVAVRQMFFLTRACAVQPLENSKASTSIFVLQATKSQRRMPWRLKPKKDVGDCEKPREAVYQASIRGCPNGATQHLS